jgi:hypothetical protein
MSFSTVAAIHIGVGMATLEKVQRQITKLQAQADALINKQSSAVLGKNWQDFGYSYLTMQCEQNADLP